VALGPFAPVLRGIVRVRLARIFVGLVVSYTGMAEILAFVGLVWQPAKTWTTIFVVAILFAIIALVVLNILAVLALRVSRVSWNFGDDPV
jgi:hypothetical protein